MNFEYSDEQKLLAETLRKFLNTGYGFDARAKIMAGPAGYSEDVWAVLAEMGILGVPFDAAHGGFGGATVGLGGRFVARGGSAAQQAHILPALIQGKLKMAFAQTERGARYDLRHVATRAAKSGEGWVLDGEKAVVLQGRAA